MREQTAKLPHTHRRDDRPALQSQTTHLRLCPATAASGLTILLRDVVFHATSVRT